jgi:hypothetical protein
MVCWRRIGGFIVGTSVCAYHVRDRSQEECLRALAEVGAPRGFVSVEMEHWTSIIDVDTDEFELKALGKTVGKVSERLGADALITAVFDDDESWYVAFHSGKEVDRFSYKRTARGTQRRLKGNPQRIAESFSWWDGAKRLESILKKEYKMEASRLRHIVQAFGISVNGAFTKMKDLSESLPPQILESILREEDSPIAEMIRYRRSFVEYKGG